MEKIDNGLRKSAARGKRLRRRWVFGVGLVVGIVLGVLWWTPLGRRLTSRRTVADVVATLEENMREQWGHDRIETLTDGGAMALLGFKAEQQLELWKQGRDGSWQLVKRYPFTGTSGGPGPKRKRGDGQIPEGLYEIVSLNPNSRYHLSMELNYPNAMDRQQGEAEGREDLGDDIFIHGSAASIGCIPIGDPAIEEVFYLVAKNGIEKTTVILAPYDFRTKRAPAVSNPGLSKRYAEISKSLQRFALK